MFTYTDSGEIYEDMYKGDLDRYLRDFPGHALVSCTEIGDIDKHW